MLTLDEPGVKLNLEDFSELKKLAGGCLPQAFKKFHLKNNGGYTQNKRLTGAEYIYSIHGFDSIKAGEPPIEFSYGDFIENYPSHTGLIPFAFDEGGNYYIVSVREVDYGFIYLWLQEDEELQKIFDDFDSFLTGLNQ